MSGVATSREGWEGRDLLVFAGVCLFFPSRIYLGYNVPLNEIIVLVLTSDSGKETRER